MASHVIGYIGRINDRDLVRIDEWGETANYKGSDYIGQVGIEDGLEIGVSRVHVGGRGAHPSAGTVAFVRHHHELAQAR